MSPPPRVVVTYAHGTHDRVCVDLSDRLRMMGVDCEIDAYEDSPEEGWGRWMTRMMSERIVLMVCDETYYRHFSLGSPDGVGRGVTFESGLLVQRFVESQGKNDFLYPVLRDRRDSKWIPEFLRSATRFIIPDQFELLYRVLTKQPKHPRPPLGQIVRLDEASHEAKLPSAPSVKRRIDDPQPMLTWDYMVPEDFVYVRITPEPPERVLIMTDAVRRTIVDFVSSLPAVSNLHAEPTRDGVLFVSDEVPEWQGEELRIDQYGGESSRVQRARRQVWIRTDGDVEVRLTAHSGNAVQQLVRTLATAWALATNFAPLFGARAPYRGRFAYRLERVESGGFPIGGLYQDWLEGDLATNFADAFLGPVLEAQSVGGHAGDPDETWKLLQSSWQTEIIRGEPATTVPSDSGGSFTAYMTPDSPSFPGPSAVRVYSTPQDWSSGFFYSPSHVFTCAHGLRTLNVGSRVQVRFADQTTGTGVIRKFYPSGRSAGASFPDAAIIEVPDAARTPMRLRVDRQYVDMSVGFGYFGFPVSSPEGIYVVVRLTGHRAISGRINDYAYRIEGEVERGASGSALVSNDGEVVGVVVSVQTNSDRGSAVPMHLLIDEVPELREVAGMQAAFAPVPPPVRSNSSAVAVQPTGDPSSDPEFREIRDQARAGHATDALRRLQAIVDDPSFASREPHSQGAHLRLAATLVLAVKNDVETARTLVDRARQYNADAAVVIDARIVLAAGDIDGALAIIHDRHDIDTDVTRVGALYFGRRTAEAVVEVSAARERHPDEGEIMRMEALVLLAAGRQVDSVTAARRALAANPANAMTRWTLGVTLYHARFPRELLPAVIDGPPPTVPSDMLVAGPDAATSSAEAVRHIQDALALLDTDAEQRPSFLVWLVAALLLAGRRDEATAEARAALALPNPIAAVIPWAIRWDVPIDLDDWSAGVRRRVDDGTASIDEVQIYADLDVVRGDGAEAERVMTLMREAFISQGAESIWRVTVARSLARRSRYAEALVVLDNADERLAEALRSTEARRAGEDVRGRALAAYRQSGDAIYLLEAVETSLLAGDAPWAEEHVPELVDRLQTRSATEAALAVLFNVGDYAGWERLYNDRLAVLDPDDTRVAQMHVGVLVRTGRLRAAADIAERQLHVAPSPTAHYRLGYIYVQLADVEGLARTGRSYLQAGAADVSIALQFAEWLAASSADLAGRLFDAVIERDLPLEAVQTALVLAHTLGRDDRTAPLMRRMPELLAAGMVQTGNVADLRDIMRERRETVRSLNASYRDGLVPIHALADDQHFPILHSHVLVADSNATVAPSAWTPIFIRHAARGSIDGTVLDATDTIAMEITTLLLLHSLGLSEVVGARWPVIIVSRNLGAIAQAAVRSFQSAQPARDAAQARVVAHLDAGRIGTLDVPAHLGIVERKLWPYAEAERRGAVAVDWGTYLDPASGEVVEPPEIVASRGIDAWTLVVGLRNAGELTAQQELAALASLGPNRPPVPAELPAIRGSTVILAENLAEWLENAGVLHALVSCAASVLIDTDQVERLRIEVRDAERKRRSAEAAEAFARYCADRLADGRFVSVPTLAGFEFGGRAHEQAREFFEFLGADVGGGAALAVDDRFASQWPEREGTPIVGVAEILDSLRRRGLIDDARFFDALLTLRSRALFFVVVTSEEIIRHVTAANVVDGMLVETAELRIIRRYLAFSLAILHRDDDVAARSVEENAFATASSSHIRAAITMLYDANDDSTEARAQWVLRNLWFDDISTYSALPTWMPGLRADAVADMADALLFMDVLAGGPEGQDAAPPAPDEVQDGS